MTELIKTEPAPGIWVIRAGGAVLGESRNAVMLKEGDYEAVIYIPRADLAMAFFDKSNKTTVCPHKGTANYYTIQTKSKLLEDVAWSYETPHADLGEIAGHLAFCHEDVTVEKL